MKRKIWLALLILTAFVGVLFWQRWQGVAFNAQSPERTVQHLVAQQVSLPTVDSQRLLTDLNAIASPRHSATDRAAIRRYITQSLQDSGWTVQGLPFENGINLYAERAGTDAAAGSILLGAHYDTVERSPGADDNATSVATVLEAARLLSPPTPRSLKLMFFDLEEAGLLGSQAFLADPLQKAELQDNLKGAIILDMVGYACHTAGCQSYPPLPITPPTDQGDFLAVLGNQSHPELLESFPTRPNLPQVLTLAVPTLGDFTPDLVRSDHAPFWKKGLGAVLVTDTANFRNPHYHQPSDTLETIDSEFFLGSAQIIINAVTTLLQ